MGSPLRTICKVRALTHIKKLDDCLADFVRRTPGYSLTD